MSARALGGAGNATKATLNSGIGGSLTLAKPANTTNGDYLVAFIYARGETAPLPAPAGWMRVDVPMPVTGLGQANVFHRRITNAAGEATSYDFAFTGGNRKAGMIFRVTGAHPSRFVSAVSLSTITRSGTEANTATPVPDIPAKDSLGLTFIGVNYSAPTVPPNVSTFYDEIGSAPVDYVTTTAGAGETVGYVLSTAIPERDALGVNHVFMPTPPNSGAAFMLIVNSDGVAPEVSAGADRSVDAGGNVTLTASAVAGVVDRYEWREVGGSGDFTVSSNTRELTFTPTRQITAANHTFEVRGRDSTGSAPIWGAWARTVITVRAHQVWTKEWDGALVPVEARRMWTLSDNTLIRPGDVYVPDGITVPEMLAKTTFYSAHRGGGNEFPEHTMESYQGAVSGGLDAIEVSVRVTKDGEMVCFHDDTLDRTTNATGPIGDYTYDELVRNVRVTRSAILGEAQPGVLIPRAVDVLARFAGKKVIFLEGKDGAAHARLFAELDKYAAQGVNLGDWFIQKQFFQGGTWTKDAARARGIKVWGYMAVDTTDAQLDAEDYRCDLWGVPDFMPLERKAQIVARGKPVICWEVHRRAQVEEHQSIGLKGQMSASALYVSRPAQRQLWDTFATRRKAPGDMWTANIAVDNLALTYDGNGGASHKYPDPICTTVMGSMCPVKANAEIRLTMSWATTPTSGASGVAFGCRNDEIFRPAADFVNKVGGYYLGVSASMSRATLFRYDPGAWNPIEIASAQLPGRVPKDDIPVMIQIHSGGIRITVAGASIASTDTRYTGGYFHIAQGNNNTLTTFSKISV